MLILVLLCSHEPGYCYRIVDMTLPPVSYLLCFALILEHARLTPQDKIFLLFGAEQLNELVVEPDVGFIAKAHGANGRVLGVDLADSLYNI